LARVGILGGTFNPPHVGHMICAQEACAALGLDRVVLMPTGVPPHKEVPEEPGAQHRLEMCVLAAAEDHRLDASDREVRRDGPSWTVDTLREIHDASRSDQLTFIVGGDMARTLGSWREPEAILELAELGVAERAGNGRSEIEEALAPLGAGDRVRFFDMPRIDVSSTDVRRRVREGAPFRWLVPAAVAEYVLTQGLYR
jgi:nicotinate-nucleotide adenylyltransferase